jgi:hypothetical protein
MDQQISGVNPTQAYDQTNKTRETERQRLDQLILAGPAPAQQVKDIQTEQDQEATTATDRVELSKKDVQATAATNSVKTPDVGPSIPVQAGDISFPVDGRGAAVAVQERLSAELNTPQFEETAKALGVTDVESFERAVESGDALATFAMVDPTNIYLVDAHRNEIHAENLSSFANAELVIRPRSEALDPNHKLKERLENPIMARINDPSLQAQDMLAHRPPQPQDSVQVAG